MEIVHVGKMKTFLGSEREEVTTCERVTNEEGAEEEGKAEERPDQRKRGKGGRQGKRVQFNIPEEVHGEHEIDHDGEGPQQDKDQLRRSTRARRAPDRYSPEVGLAVAVLLLGFCGSILGVRASEGGEQSAFVRDGVIFKSRGEVYFSDSEWVVVTDVS
jgi:hypothetical protein